MPRLLLYYHHFASSFCYFPEHFCRAGFKVDACGPANHPVRHSAYISDFHALERKDKTLLSCLQHQHDDFLIPIDEPAALWVRDNRSAPELEGLLPIPSDSTLWELVDNKLAFAKWAEEQILPHPRNIFVETLEDAHRATQEIGYPCLLKGSSGSGGTAVHVLENVIQLTGVQNSGLS